MTKTALITGITGQDGSYLAEFLLHRGYEVHGLLRPSSTPHTARIDRLLQASEGNPRLRLHAGDLSTSEAIGAVVAAVKPDEVYHLAAQSHVHLSFATAEYTGNATGLSTVRVLEALRRSAPEAKYYQASSSEMFGNSPAPQGEDTPFSPRSPYAAAKVFAYWTTVMYRNAYGMFASNGILFNHESPRRGGDFVTRKICKAIARIVAGKQDKLYLGNLDSARDWGYAPEYVETMWNIMQLDEPTDVVVGTGETHTVREFLNEAFAYVDLDAADYVEFDESLVRPADVDCLVADSSKARELIGWRPRIKFHALVRLMIDAEFSAEGLEPPLEGFAALEGADLPWVQEDRAPRQTAAARKAGSRSR